MLDIQKSYLKERKKKMRSLHNDIFTMNLYYSWLCTAGLDPAAIGVKQAHEFQSYVMTAAKADGGIRYSRDTACKVISTMKNFYTYLKEKGIVAANPFTEMKRVKQGKRLPVGIYSEEEMRKLLAYLGEFWQEGDLKAKRNRYRAHVICELLYATGMTIGDVMRLELADIDLKRGVVVVRENRAGRRECLLNEYAAIVLKHYITSLRRFLLASPNYNGRRNLLFGSGTELKKMVSRELNKACDKLQLKPIKTKDFRHALGLHLVKAGCDARFVQEIIGHARLNSTQLYIKINKRDLKGVLDQFHPRVYRSQA